MLRPFKAKPVSLRGILEGLFGPGFGKGSNAKARLISIRSKLAKKQ